MKSLFQVDPNAALTNAANGNPSYTGVQLHTSTQAIPIPIMWGTRRISPNIIWQSTLVYNFGFFLPVSAFPSPPPNIFQTAFSDPTGFTAYPGGAPICARFFGQVQQSVDGSHLGTQYGNTDASSTNCRWWVPMILALCEGPVNPTPLRVWNGGAIAPLNWGPQLNDSHNSQYYSIYYSLLTGSGAQTVWGLFAAATGLPGGLYPGQDLAYRYTACVVSPLFDTGHNNVPFQQSFEIVRTPNAAYAVNDSYGIGKDYSLADIIPDLLTSLQYGAGMSPSDIDAASLLQFWNYLAAQGIYFSPLLTAQTKITDIIDRWASLSNCWIYWNGTAFVFVPLGDETITGNARTYIPDTAAAYNLSNADFLDQGLSVQRADPIDCNNRLRIEFTDRFNQYAKSPVEWKDQTLINLYGIRDASSVNADDICDVAVARIVVELLGKRMAYIRNHYSFTLSYRYLRILPGTIVTVTDPNLGLDHVAVRVRTVEEDEQGRLAIVAEEYPGTLGMSRPQASQSWLQQGGGAGSGSTGGGGVTGLPTSTSGGGLVMDSTMTLVLFVAGDVITLPPALTTSVPYVLKHDQLRSPQPTPPLLEDNPVTFQRPGGATYNLEDPSDGTLAPATSVKVRGPSGLTVRLVSTGDGIVRCVQ